MHRNSIGLNMCEINYVVFVIKQFNQSIYEPEKILFIFNCLIFISSFSHSQKYQSINLYIFVAYGIIHIIKITFTSIAK